MKYVYDNENVYIGQLNNNQIISIIGETLYRVIDDELYCFFEFDRSFSTKGQGLSGIGTITSDKIINQNGDLLFSLTAEPPTIRAAV